MACRQFVATADRFWQTGWLRLNYVARVNCFDYKDKDPSLPRWQRRSRAAARLAVSYDSVPDILGPGMTKLLMLWLGVPLRIIGDVSRRHA